MEALAVLAENKLRPPDLAVVGSVAIEMPGAGTIACVWRRQAR